MGGGVGDGDEQMGEVEALVGGGGEVDVGFAVFVAEDFHVVPGEFGAKASAEGLRYGLFGGKAARKVGDRIFEFVAVVLFTLREYAIEEMLPVPFNTLPHTLDFDDIVA